MAVDRRQKHKKKREEKKKSRHQQAEKAEEYDWYARRAYHLGEYKEALTWALKKLKLEPNDAMMRSLAIHSAKQVDDQTALFPLLRQSYEADTLSGKEDHFLLGKLAFDLKHFKLAKEVFEGLLEDPSSLTGRIPKAKLKDAGRFLLFSRLMLTKPAPWPRPLSPHPHSQLPGAPVACGTQKQVRYPFGIFQ